MDRDLPTLDALRCAWRDTEPVQWKVVALAAIAALIALAVATLVGSVAVLAGPESAAVLLVALIPLAVVVSLMWVSAYRQLLGGGP